MTNESTVELVPTNVLCPSLLIVLLSHSLLPSLSLSLSLSPFPLGPSCGAVGSITKAGSPSDVFLELERQCLVMLRTRLWCLSNPDGKFGTGTNDPLGLVQLFRSGSRTERQTGTDAERERGRQVESEKSKKVQSLMVDSSMRVAFPTRYDTHGFVSKTL